MVVDWIEIVVGRVERERKENFFLHRDEMVDNENVWNLIATLQEKSKWDLNARNLMDGDMKILGQELQRKQNCHVLHLHLNNISEDGIAHLADMLKVNKMVTDLYLGANQIGD